MNTTEMLRLVDSISRERNVDKDLLLGDLEQALASAARKQFDADLTEDFSCEIDRLNGKVIIRRGEEEIPLEDLGRIPAQTAKQVMIQRFREDERGSIYNDFIDRVGELVTGMAQRYEGGALVVSIDRAEGFMPRSEQIPGEQHQPGERVRCFILDVRDTGRQVKIVLSRGHEDMVRRLFEVEVPEVAERIIEIKAMAREAGHRTKIAVNSIDSKVDAVGACVGVRGSRIKNIVDELGGEKIDIVRWNESSQILIQNALKPAEIFEISLCFELGRATVVVNEDQLSLAIGKRGQNVRLAARLTAWDVDILTPTEFTKALEIIEQTFGGESAMLSEEQIDRLGALGVISVFDIEEVGATYLSEQLGLDQELADQVVATASAKAKEVAQQQQQEKEEAAQRKAQADADADAQSQAMPGADRAAAILGDLGGEIGSASATPPATPASADPEASSDAAVGTYTSQADADGDAQDTDNADQPALGEPEPHDEQMAEEAGAAAGYANQAQQAHATDQTPRPPEPAQRDELIDTEADRPETGVDLLEQGQTGEPAGEALADQTPADAGALAGDEAEGEEGRRDDTTG